MIKLMLILLLFAAVASVDKMSICPIFTTQKAIAQEEGEIEPETEPEPEPSPFPAPEEESGSEEEPEQL